jgi:methyl-accepting chemotaxis protein
VDLRHAERVESYRGPRVGDPVSEERHTSGSVEQLRIGLAPKLAAGTALSVLLISAVLSVRATTVLQEALVKAFQTRGEAIALSLAAATESSVGSSISTVQSSIDSNKIIGGVTYIYVQDAEGSILVHTFSPAFPPGLEKANPVSAGEDLGTEIVAGVAQHRRVKLAPDLYFDNGGKRYHVIDVAAPVSGGALGVVHVGMDINEIEATVRSLRRAMWMWGGLAGVIGLVLSLVVVVAAVILPIRELTRVTGDIVRNGDLTQTIALRSRDEVGQLAATFSQMVDKLRQIPRSLNESVQLLHDSVAGLSASTTEQSSSVSRHAVALQETQVTAQQIKQTSVVAAQKADEVLKIAERAERIGRDGATAIDRSMAGLAEIRSEVTGMADKIGELGERTQQISGITATVKDLADQSNMLALNAAIEAVRSGEHGKGFAVVAREIRSLADQSIAATSRVREILEDVAKATRSAVAMSEKGAQKMETGLSEVRASGENMHELTTIVTDTSGAVRQIAAAVSQQNAGIGQIFIAVTDLSKLMDDTVNRIDSMNRAVDLLKEVSERVAGIVRSYRF